jgi:hypothetical protein
MIRFFPQKYGSTFSRPIANTELGGKDWKNGTTTVDARSVKLKVVAKFYFFSEMPLSEVCASSGAGGLRFSMMVGLAGRKPCSKTKNHLGMKTPPA